jgi:hypothetical protein
MSNAKKVIDLQDDSGSPFKLETAKKCGDRLGVIYRSLNKRENELEAATKEGSYDEVEELVVQIEELNSHKQVAISNYFSDIQLYNSAGYSLQVILDKLAGGK